ncbi:LPS-assembly protein LptD [Thermocrinis sp.]
MLIAWLIIFLAKITFGIEVFSNYLERQSDGLIHAREEVEVYHEKYYIKADAIRYNPDTKEIVAEGNVYVRSLDGRLEAKGSYAYINLEKDVGYYLNAEGRFERFHFEAKRLEKSGELYTVEDGQITTCPSDRKEMVLCFSQAKMDKKYVFSTNNSLKLFRLPLAYLPLFAYPIGQRRSGLLPPTVGSNSYNNLIYQQPIYWAISRNKDATLTLDFRDKQAKGFSLEYRQAFFKENDLTLDVSYYVEPKPPGKWWEGRDPNTFRKNRYRFKLDLDFQDFKAGLDTISDPYFLEDTYLKKTERTKPYLTSYISYTREFDRFFLSFNAKHFYDTTSPDNKHTLHKLPEINLYWKPQHVIDNVFLSAFLSYTNFYREVGLRGQRVLLFPEISIPKRILGRILHSQIILENLHYFGLNQEGYKNNITSIYFSESMPFTLDFERERFNLKNFFVVSYSFRPKDFNNPKFDNLDELNRKNQIDATTISSLSYAGREFLKLYLSTGYNYLGKYAYAGSTAKRKIIPIRTILSLKPLEGLSFYNDSLYDIEGGDLLNTSSNVSLGYKKTTLTIGQILSRNFSGQKLSDQTTLNLSTAYNSAIFALSLTKDNRIKKDLTRQVTLDYKGACWSFGLLARDNYDGTKGRYVREFYITFNIFDLQRLTVPLRR